MWSMNSSPDFAAVNAKFSSKDIRQLGLQHLNQQAFETDSDDEDFDDNSAANQESEDRDYQGGADGDEMSETSEEMKELVAESDMDMEGVSDHEASNPSVWVRAKNDGIETTENGGISCIFRFVCLKHGNG